MKRLIAVLCLIAVLVTVGVGCSKLQSNADYRMYVFDINQGRFWDIGVSLSFSKDAKGYSMRYAGGIEIMGEVSTTYTGYLLTCPTDVYLQALQAKEDIMGEVDGHLSEESYTALSNVITTQTQLFVYGDYLFSSANVDLVRKVDMGDDLRNYTSVEGYYESASDPDKTYLFSRGLIYANATDKDGKVVKDDKGKVTYETTPSARYQLHGGMIIFTVIDAAGNDVYIDGVKQSLTYLFATISYPKDLAAFVYTEDAYSEEVKELATYLAGKSVGVLTKTFYALSNPN